jgi:hypothetical protein
VRGRVLGGALVLGWLVTRLYLCHQLVGPNAFFYTGDVGLYKEWSPLLADGGFPAGDTRWQYPPAVAPFLLLPRVLPGSYLVGFVALALLADAAVLMVLARMAKRHGSWLGCWYWIAGIALCGGIVLGRLDVFATALAVSALGFAGSSSAFGAITGIAAAIKAWPAALLVGAPPGRLRRTVLVAAAAGGGITLAYALFTRDALSFLRGQQGRGLEFESALATPFLVGRKLGLWTGTVTYRFGSMEVVGPHVGLVSKAAFFLPVLAACWLVVWRWRLWRLKAVWRPETVADAALTATLMLVVTSRVISPQYMIWLVGLAACCVASTRTSQGLPAVLVLIAIPLTFLEYRILWFSLVAGHGVPTAVLTLRNVLLVAATVIAARNLWRSTVRAEEGDGTPAPPDRLRDLAPGMAARRPVA